MPRPSPSNKEETGGGMNTSQQLACISVQLRSLEEGQSGIREVLQQLHVSLKSGGIVDVGTAISGGIVDVGTAKNDGQLDIQEVLQQVQTSLQSGNAVDADVAQKQKPDLPKKAAATKSAAGASNGFEKAGRLSFVAGQKTVEQRREQTLKNMFSVAEEMEAAELEAAASNTTYTSYLARSLSTMSRHDLEAKLDVFIGGVIMANSIFIGLHMDFADGNPIWLITDLIFSLIFVCELTFKIWVHGFMLQFCGSSALANCFDAFLILLDVAQLIIELASPKIAKELDSAPSASLFRIVRLLRLTRLVRAMKSDVFKSLAEMVHGIAAGMTTLAWSFILFFAFLYIVSLVLREALGRSISGDVATDRALINEMFGSVPRSIFTTFRCSFGDCTFRDGSPIFESVLPQHGVGWVVFYSMAIFIVSIVLFNVISAMFVERTMAAATALTMEKKRARLQDEKHLFSKVTLLIKHIMEFAPNIEAPETKLSTSISEVMKMEVPLSVMDEAINDPYVKSILNELDINPQDHRRLTDIFDPDNGGTVELADVAIGIRRMRGDPRRSDIVCVDLMVRSMQTVLHETLTLVKEIRNALHD
eukprot:TRINITY_DN10819_c0_g1_i1.p1 TRINITY_DN10819_c0_g1~~TRINITY_DN10819_c0_g1_i1.p1  ORF type:complete len:590 (+),score=122.64 TRINITY_DN10819_c0_g1_i1:140-1909(+)